MRRYPQFKSTPSQVAYLPSVGSAQEIQTTNRRRYRQFGITPNSVSTLPSVGVSAASGGQTLTPSLYADGDTFYAPAVATGSVALTPALYVDGDTFYAATVVDYSWQQVATASGVWTDKPLSGGTWTTL